MSADFASASARNFSMTSSSVDNGIQLYCKGRLTMNVTDAFKHEVKSRFENGRRIVLDMGGLTQIDSSGLGAVVQLFVSARTAGCTLQICNLSGQVKQLFGVTRVLSAFESCGWYMTRIP